MTINNFHRTGGTHLDDCEESSCIVTGPSFTKLTFKPSKASKLGNGPQGKNCDTEEKGQR